MFDTFRKSWEDAQVDLPPLQTGIALPAKLRHGDRVRLVSPASPPTKEGVAYTAAFLESLGLHVEVADHALDEFGYLAGTDDDRASDFNDALRDPEVKAIIATRGGKGAYRIADKLDFGAAAEDPKILVGFSEISILHLALWKNCQLPGIHGAPWDSELFGATAQQSFVDAVFTSDEITLDRRSEEPTGDLTTSGKATGSSSVEIKIRLRRLLAGPCRASMEPFCCSKHST